MLPCHAVEETTAFYRAIGFDVPHLQTRPYAYAIVKRGGIELHFFVVPSYDPKTSYSTCYVFVPDVDAIYQAFADGFRKELGKIPSRGLPRLTQPRDRPHGVREFAAIDPGGNWIRIGQQIAAPDAEQAGDGGAPRRRRSKLEKALLVAAQDGDSRGEPELAIAVLDKALAKPGEAPAKDRLQAFVYRADLALAVDDNATAKRMLADARSVMLTQSERAGLRAELDRMAELEEMLGSPAQPLPPS